ncbi:type II toxin-antitoxin system VapC family toxin [Tianweitania sp.]|uniref:type II toxin-antitoxin system VapC family toxin n=1 Tax=Tianweitania sp. TaxID=2021634 RepID=UPI0028A09DED|nr:type II toxin-antitoxin system VapC family toxin [Tianweitania sp.]
MIIDASVAIPWLIETPFSPAARALRPLTPTAPSLLMLETANVLLKYQRQSHPTFDIVETMKLLRVIIPNLVDDQLLLPSAIKLAEQAGHKIYDCLYLALALQTAQPLATADKRLAVIAETLSIKVHLIEANA